MQKFSLTDQALQLLFPEFRFGETDIANAERLVDLGVGGFCVYRGSAREVFELTRRLQERASIPLLFCADYEDGIASHVPDGTALPSNMGIGASGDPKLAFEKGRLTAIEARAIGVRWVLAPVVDLASQPANPIVNIRAFGSDPSFVSRMAAAYMRGLRAGGALSCAKHFPGHGETVSDSHLELPLLRLSRRRLEERDLVPYRRTRTLADSVMAAHLKFAALGDAAKLPASLSKTVLDGILRKKIGYKGLIMTDALSMSAIAKHFTDETASIAALRAGADIILYPADSMKAASGLPEWIEKNPDLGRQVEISFQRVLKAKKDCGLLKDRGMPREKDLALVGCQKHRAAAERMARACLAWARKPERSLARHFGYLELGAASQDEWKGGAFIEALRSQGVRVEPYREGLPALVTSFMKPTAYSGKIQFGAQERRPVQAALSSTGGAALVSFASPFTMDQFRGYSAGLCAFAANEASQKAAADALAGKLRFTGRLPVSLRSPS